jgi:probable F420-dependent oxidoreductase
MSLDQSQLIAATRQRLGPVGVWCGQPLMTSLAAQVRDAARAIEALGYGSIWSGEVLGGKDVFVQAALVLSVTERITFGSGIANLWARHPTTMLGAGATVGDAWPDRFVNGIGVSHSFLVQGSGQDYSKPLEKMRNYLQAMDETSAFMPAVAAPVPRVLAALRPKMLELARDRADGAHPYFVPPSHTPFARGILGPDRLLIPEQAVVLCTDPAEARRVAREHLAVYLTLPNYVNNLNSLGYGDDDLVGGGSDRLVDALVAWGDETAIRTRVQELLDSGADHVALQILAPGLAGVVQQLTALAPALKGLVA